MNSKIAWDSHIEMVVITNITNVILGEVHFLSKESWVISLNLGSSIFILTVCGCIGLKDEKGKRGKKDSKVEKGKKKHALNLLNKKTLENYSFF